MFVKVPLCYLTSPTPEALRFCLFESDIAALRSIYPDRCSL